MFTIGGTGVLLNKYLGPIAQGTQLSTSAPQVAGGNTLTFSNTNGINNGMFVFGNGVPANTTVLATSSTTVTLNNNLTAAVASGVTIGFSNDATQPSYTNQSAMNIQDLLWAENRDRKYDTTIYKMRGIYQRADQDFDLSQFGLFLQTGTIFMVFHLRDMVDMIGRKLMAGDVLEFQHLKDYDALNEDLPAALKRYYVVSDCSFASEGFSPTWWPHLWRVKLNPLVDSQEYKDILNNIKAGDDNVTTQTLGNVLSTYNTYLNLNESILAQAEFDVPLSGYDTTSFYTLPTNGNITEPRGNGNIVTADSFAVTADSTSITTDDGLATPITKIQGYLTGDGKAPNSLITGAGISFPSNPSDGEYFLRLDYLPNRLFRYDGQFWRKVEDAVRTNITPGASNNQTMRAGYVNNTNTYTDSTGAIHNERQSLSTILTPKADNQ